MVIVYGINNAKSNASQSILNADVIIKHNASLTKSRPSIADGIGIVFEQMQFVKSAMSIVRWITSQNVNPANPVVIEPAKVTARHHARSANDNVEIVRDCISHLIK